MWVKTRICALHNTVIEEVKLLAGASHSAARLHYELRRYDFIVSSHWLLAVRCYFTAGTKNVFNIF